jgi:hypothetical protein
MLCHCLKAFAHLIFNEILDHKLRYDCADLNMGSKLKACSLTIGI